MIKKLFLFLSLVNLFTCGGESSEQIANSTTTNAAIKGPQQLVASIPIATMETSIPALSLYQEEIKTVLTSKRPVVLMEKKAYTQPKMLLAQELALANPEFVRDIYYKETGQALHNEITGIRQLTNQEVLDFQLNLPATDCYRVEMYNYFYNATALAIVDVKNRRVLGVNHLPAIAPEDNKRIEDLAAKIAIHYPEVAEQLNTSVGVFPSDYKRSIQDSKCERTRHYCVAVVFEKENKKLWVIVDVNDWMVIGWQWIENETKDRPVVVSQRTIQNAFVMEDYCNKDNQLKKKDWAITYTLTSSDGLEIKNVKFKGKEVVHSAKLVDWHVSYTFNDGFGYSDAIGCPMYSAAAVVAFSAPEIINIEGGGFALIQDFRSPVWPLACNYRYQNRYEFYPDGSFRITGVNLGIGCGAGGQYRPVFRIDMGSTNEDFAHWDGQNWKTWDIEHWHLQDEQSAYTPEGYLYKISTDAAGYFMEPGKRQFGDGGRGDNAYTYITVKNEGQGEGELDMPTFGECCNTDYHQGPETFMNPAEKLAGKELIIWYVPQMYNDNEKGQEYCWAAVEVNDMGKATFKTWQGVIGPKFIPFNK